MHPIVIYISCPRAYSVTVTRVMEQSGHFNIRHEPYGSVHLKKYYPQVMDYWCRKTCYQTPEEIKADIFKLSEEKPVFVKDMALSIHDFIIDDLEFLSNPNVYFVFAYRHPSDIIHSLYEKTEEIVHQNVDTFYHISAYENLFKLYCKILQYNVNTLLLNVSDFYSAINKLFIFLNLKLDDGDFVWDSCDTDDKLENKAISWRENKVLPIFKHWHGTALMSSGIKLTNHQYDCLNGRPTFAEVAENHRENIIKCYDKCMIFYDLLEKIEN